jgi:membrane associated rhomboid family serine protease
VRALVTDYKGRLAILIVFVGVMWLEEVLDTVIFGGALDGDGIHPRDLGWLWGIVLAPFLHGGFAHLIANTVPLFVLGWLVIVRRRMDFFLVTAIVTLLGGLGVWLFGMPGTVHLGASGVVFGYLGYLFFRAWFERSFTAMAIALVAGVLYGGALWGVLPTRAGVSWEGHLFGFAGGAATARIWSPRRLRRPELYGRVTL